MPDLERSIINNNPPPILARLGLDDVTWLDELNQFNTKGKRAFGTIEKLKAYVKNIKHRIKANISLRPALE